MGLTRGWCLGLTEVLGLWLITEVYAAVTAFGPSWFFPVSAVDHSPAAFQTLY